MDGDEVRVRRERVERFYDQVLPAAQQQAKAAAKGRTGTGRFGPSGRMVRQVPLAAVMNAVELEGPKVLSADADGYWADMERRHPEIAVGGSGTVRPGKRNRFGKVTATCVNGVWVGR